METRFQTSFIPKKPTTSTIGGISSAPKHRHGASVFMSIATVLFILSLVGAGGTYAWKQYLISAQDTYKQDLATREKQFNIDLIEQLKGANVKIDMAHKLLTNHLALSQIFDIIGRMTAENVRFLSMDVSVPKSGSDGVNVSLQGYGTSFSAVAFQSDVLNQLDQYGLRKIIKNPILSNPALGGNGAVSFGFVATVDSGSLSYEKSVSSVGAPAGSQSAATSTP
jgi:hypothetical protein